MPFAAQTNSRSDDRSRTMGFHWTGPACAPVPVSARPSFASPLREIVHATRDRGRRRVNPLIILENAEPVESLATFSQSHPQRRVVDVARVSSQNINSIHGSWQAEPQDTHVLYVG